ncbi:MAG: energy transducer TonB [Gammaproteobacteria bacterium]|nr:energy transducer TonB [Gammaproteobacteria bacterium]
MRSLVSSNISLLSALPVDAGMVGKGRGVLTADRLGPLAGVIAAHLALLFWANSVMMHEASMSTSSAPVVTGVLLAPPAPEPVVEPPKPLPMKRPVPREPEPVPPEEPLVDIPIVPPDELASEEVITQAAPAPAPPEEGEPEPEAPRVIPPRIDASQLDNPAPTYPARSRQLREQGRVLLDVYILPDGSVGEIRLRASSGFQRLDRSALETVKLWRYVPAMRGGQPIPYWYVQPINFLLR